MEKPNCGTGKSRIMERAQVEMWNVKKSKFGTKLVGRKWDFLGRILEQ